MPSPINPCFSCLYAATVRGFQGLYTNCADCEEEAPLDEEEEEEFDGATATVRALPNGMLRPDEECPEEDEPLAALELPEELFVDGAAALEFPAAPAPPLSCMLGVTSVIGVAIEQNCKNSEKTRTRSATPSFRVRNSH